jgi:hypothetical protein
MNNLGSVQRGHQGVLKAESKEVPAMKESDKQFGQAHYLYKRWLLGGDYEESQI